MKKGCNKKILIGIVAAGIFFSVLFFILKKVNNKNEEPENRFSKGVLAINTNKSYYKVNEKVEIGMASLDYKGDTLCKSNLKMIIKNPDGKENGTTFFTVRDEADGLPRYFYIYALFCFSGS